LNFFLYIHLLLFLKKVSKKFKAPWVPTIKNPLDAENFDTISDSEKDKSENGVLKKSEQKAFKDF